MKIGALSTVGKSVISKYSDTLDVAFVEFNSSSWTRTTQVLNSSGWSIHSVAPSTGWIENAIIQKVGAASGTRTGSITYPTTTTSVKYDDGVTRYFKDVVKFSNYSEGGDSGGPVLRIENNVVRLLGITFAGNQNGAHYGYGIKHYNISNSLGIEAYTELTQQ